MKLKRIFAVVLALLMFTVSAKVSHAENIVTANPGDTVQVSFSVSDVYGVDGDFTWTNGALVKDSVINGTGMTGKIENERAYFYGTDKATLVVIASVTVSENAQAGDQIALTFNYETSDAKGNMSTWQAETAFINVVAASGGGGGSDTTPDTPVTPPAQDTPSTPSQPTTPSKPVVAVDYTELERQIKIAESLDEGDYTKDSWKALEKALASAYGALKSKDQAVVDKAAEDLAAAIKKLVIADYDALKAAIKDGEALAEGDELGNLWFQLFKAIQNGADLIGSGDQAAVDAATEKILGLIKQIKDALAAAAEVEPEVITEEVIVEVEPSGDFCNISMHTVWPILFFVSLAGNVALIAILVVTMNKRKKNQKDDTPLVDYQIGDDE